jgi:threonine synthase
MLVANPISLKCVLCGKDWDPSEVYYTCPDCGLDGTLDVVYDYGSIRSHFNRDTLKRTRKRNLWRYGDILPVKDPDKVAGLQVGWTPLYKSPKLAGKYSVKEVYIKDDGRNPTGSLKDRASAVGVAKALEFSQRAVACASTGNAAGSLAGMAAVADMPAYIFVPENAPAAKITQLLVYGAEVILVKGTYEDVFNLATVAIDRWGWYNRNCAVNPYLVEGKKTCALEIAEQLNWDVPDRIFVPVGDGCIISSVYKAFYDLIELGITEKMPRITGVQAEGSSPIYRAIKDGAEKVSFGPAHSIADSISVGAPRNWAKALRAVRKSGGDMVSVSDQEILKAIPELARTTGVFGEPAGVTGFAGFRKYADEGRLAREERVVLMVTGNGLKDIESAKRSAGFPLIVGPDLDELARALDSKEQG